MTATLATLVLLGSPPMIAAGTTVDLGLPAVSSPTERPSLYRPGDGSMLLFSPIRDAEQPVCDVRRIARDHGHTPPSSKAAARFVSRACPRHLYAVTTSTSRRIDLDLQSEALKDCGLDPYGGDVARVVGRYRSIPKGTQWLSTTRGKWIEEIYAEQFVPAPTFLDASKVEIPPWSEVSLTSVSYQFVRLPAESKPTYLLVVTAKGSLLRDHDKQHRQTEIYFVGPESTKKIAVTEPSRPLATVDIDGDGDVDVLFGNDALLETQSYEHAPFDPVMILQRWGRGYRLLRFPKTEMCNGC